MSADALPHRSADEIIARLDAELDREGSGVLATDADGTLWDGDVGIDIFDAVLAAAGIREEAHARLREDASSVGVSAAGSPTAVASALYAAHLDERYPHDRAFAMMAWAFAGWHRDEVSAFAAEVLDRRGIEARIRPEMVAILRWAERRGVPIYVVSASPIAIVERGAARLGVHVTRALAMTPRIDDKGVLLPELDGPVVYGEGKIQALTAAGVTAQILGAFGDSAYDAAMLRRARVPVAVTPAPALQALLPGIDGVAILKRQG